MHTRHTSFLWLLAFFVASSANAAFPLQPIYHANSPFSDGSIGSGSSKPMVCENLQTKINASSFCSGVSWCPMKVTLGGDDRCLITDKDGGRNNQAGIYGGAPACPANSVQVGSNCVCDADHAERLEGGVYSCVPIIENDCSANGMIFNSTLTSNRVSRARGPLGKFSDGEIACFESKDSPSGKGCKHMFTGEWGFKDDNGVDWTEGESWAFTEKDLKNPKLKGELSCDLVDDPGPNDETTIKPLDPECKNGYKGEVNGKEICVEAWTGETQGVDFGITKGPDGTTTNTKNNINCKGDQCTITETNTIKDANGNTIKETTSTTSNVNRRAYCAKNPKSSVCGGEEDPSGATKGQGGSGGGGGKGNDPGELDGSYTEIGAPKLYDKKYEGGIKGVWEKHADGLKNTSIGGLAGKLFPNYGDGGSAPSYIIDLNLGGKLNLGSYDLNFDPRVWIALKAFTILCALAVARRLVFGG
jgi:hypothetical protein